MPTPSPALSPAAEILKITGHVMLARCIGIAAELGLADLVATTPQSAKDLAEKTGQHPGALYRMLRYMASKDLFSEDEAGQFSNTPMSELLRSCVTGSLRDSVRQSWQDVVWDTYRHFPHTIETGKPSFNRAYGKDLFAFFAENSVIGARFDKAMARQSGPENAAVAAAYPFNDAKTVIDVGGGRGGLLAAILTKHANVHGILFDQAQVAADPADLIAANVKDRCDIATGNFFEAVPAGADVYTLKRILHDWTDDECVTILKNCAAALGRNGRVLAIDAVIKPGNDPDPNKALDLGIMALTHGRERTAAEFHALFERAGLKVERIIATPAPSTMSIVVGCPADM
ncbi:MAG: hypothetical protein KDE14_04350 [Rhodobacteraceae bacterium]|nr:hypothetical protein [Paracoccaceae bacterium]